MHIIFFVALLLLTVLQNINFQTVAITTKKANDSEQTVYIADVVKRKV